MMFMPNTLLEITLNVNGREHRIRFDFDLSLYSHQVLHDYLHNNHLPEQGSSAALLRVLRSGDHFIDVGAHIGYFSLLAATLVGPGGCVYSLEPDRANITRLIHHIELNNLENIVPISCAAALQTGPRELYSDGNDGGHAIWDLSTLPSFQTTETRGKAIPCRRIFAVALDDLFPNPTPDSIRAMKIDVEGAEMEVLRGAQRLLTIAQIPVIICECHRERLAFAGASESMMRDFMASLGYDTYADVHTSNSLVKLDPGTTMNTNYIFNLIFAKPAYQSHMIPPGTGSAPTP